MTDTSLKVYENVTPYWNHMVLKVCLPDDDKNGKDLKDYQSHITDFENPPPPILIDSSI